MASSGSKDSPAKTTTLEVSPLAYVSMLLHAAQFSTCPVHGILLGSAVDGVTKARRAVAVCHESPTKPLVDTALSLVQASLEEKESIVGWYTAPERLQDERPGPAALKIAAGLDKTLDSEPVLVVLQNKEISKVLKDGSTSGALKAFGKDFGQQWLEPLSNVSIAKESSAAEAAKEAYSDEEISVTDLTKHFESPESDSEWPFSVAIAKCVDKHC